MSSSEPAVRRKGMASHRFCGIIIVIFALAAILSNLATQDWGAHHRYGWIGIGLMALIGLGGLIMARTSKERWDRFEEKIDKLLGV